MVQFVPGPVRQGSFRRRPWPPSTAAVRPAPSAAGPPHRQAHLRQTADIGEAVAAHARRPGPVARICGLPDGPQPIPYLAPAG